MSRLISRDPFARTELHRVLCYNDKNAERDCDNCGRTGRLYRYETQHDGGSCDKHTGRFCSVGCFRSYTF